MTKKEALIGYLNDGSAIYDAVKLAQVHVDSVCIEDYEGYEIEVHTKNTMYVFLLYYNCIRGCAFKADRSTPGYLPVECEVNLHGSTWGGSMIKVGHIGVGMHLEFSYSDHPYPITTSEIQRIVLRSRGLAEFVEAKS